MESNIEASPPRIITWVARFLCPPSAREEVVGDLVERYRSPAQYLWEVICTTPFVIASQMRRATNPPMPAIEAFILFASLGGLNLPDPHAALPMAVRATFPTCAALIALLLRDAYRTSDRWTARRAIYDVLAVFTGIFGIEALIKSLIVGGSLAPAFLLPPLWMAGSVFALMMLFILRTGVDLDGGEIRAKGVPQPVVELERDYMRFESHVRFKNWTESLALGILMSVAIFFDLRAKPFVAAIGFTWIGITILIVAYTLTRGSPRRSPRGLDFARLVIFYREELKRQRRAIRYVWWWYFIPLFAGLGTNFIAHGFSSHQPTIIALGVAGVLTLGFFIAKLNLNRGLKLEQRVAWLGSLEERPKP